MKRAITLGIQSVRTNLVPMVVLWLMATALVVGYYHVGAVVAVLEPLVRWQATSGGVAAFMNRVVFCGLLPGVFLLSVRSIRPPRPWLTVFVYSLWGGLWGIACDCFFTLQTTWFGTGTDVTTIAKKVLVDQLVWNVFICTPPNALFFPWVARDFQMERFRGMCTFLMDVCLPMLVSNWIVWIPVMVVNYVFPLPLQIQLVGLASAFWMLVALRIVK